jgi:hypothetical protein
MNESTVNEWWIAEIPRFDVSVFLKRGGLRLALFRLVALLLWGGRSEGSSQQPAAAAAAAMLPGASLDPVVPGNEGKRSELTHFFKRG